MNTIRVYIEGKTVAKQRPIFGKGRVFTPKKTVDYERYVRDCYRSQTTEENRFLEGPIAINLISIRKIPKSSSAKQKEMMMNNEILPVKKPDLDNIAKSVLDALNGVAYNDDSQVVTLNLSKVYGNEDAVMLYLTEIKNGRCKVD